MSTEPLPPADQVERVCPDCGKTYLIAKQFANDPEEVCEPCWDAFDGIIIEELMADKPELKSVKKNERQ